jgi:hypothetical protein
MQSPWRGELVASEHSGACKVEVGRAKFRHGSSASRLNARRLASSVRATGVTVYIDEPHPQIAGVPLTVSSSRRSSSARIGSTNGPASG